MQKENDKKNISSPKRGLTKNGTQLFNVIIGRNCLKAKICFLKRTIELSIEFLTRLFITF
jgi:hypothetical protein